MRAEDQSRLTIGIIPEFSFIAIRITGCRPGDHVAPGIVDRRRRCIIRAIEMLQHVAFGIELVEGAGAGIAIDIGAGDEVAVTPCHLCYRKTKNISINTICPQLLMSINTVCPQLL